MKFNTQEIKEAAIFVKIIIPEMIIFATMARVIVAIINPYLALPILLILCVQFILLFFHKASDNFERGY